jgi:hypothetical protein
MTNVKERQLRGLRRFWGIPLALASGYEVMYRELPVLNRLRTRGITIVDHPVYRKADGLECFVRTIHIARVRGTNEQVCEPRCVVRAVMRRLNETGFRSVYKVHAVRFGESGGGLVDRAARITARVGI